MSISFRDFKDHLDKQSKSKRVAFYAGLIFSVIIISLALGYAFGRLLAMVSL